MINPLFKRSLTSGFAVASASTSLLFAHAVMADDGIFPASPAAKAAIDFDGRGFIINGKRTFITSGSLHYARVPRALWRDRLLKFKRAGVNTVETYTFWDVHEPHHGQFNFSGDADLGAFLSLAQSLGMMAVVRVGPYYCAEWDSGGYPIWLRNVPGLEVRVDNEPFKKAVGDYFDKLLPVIAAHQIQRGGNVVMVQLENEHPAGWGKDMPNGYFRFLRDKFVAAGLEVPYFFSGLHHGSDPAGDRSWDSKGRTNPWYTTEFWPGWYDLYGPLSPSNLRRFDRGTWKILAYGGNGYNYYMLHGGTNFDYLNNNEDAASYDYGSAVGQAGDLRPVYYRFKRAALFATSFPEILENSENADATYQSRAKVTAGEPLKITARTSPAGDIAFLDNNHGEAQAKVQFLDAQGAALPSAGPITLEAGEIIPIVQNYQLAPGVKLDVCAARILGISHQGKTTTLVIYGNAGDPFELHFAGRASLRDTFANTPIITEFSSGGQKIRVMAVTGDLADKTWFAQAGGKDFVVSGPDFLRDVTLQNGRLKIETEGPWSNASHTAVAYGEDSAPVRFEFPMVKRLHPTNLALANWQVGGGAEPSQPKFDDSKWLSSPTALQMGSDDDISCYAWYRTALSAPVAGNYALNYTAGNGSLTVFVDGKMVPKAGAQNGAVNLNLVAGKHDVAFFASHNGRDKLFNHLGPINEADRKGLFGPATLSQTSEVPQTVAGWKMVKVEGNVSAETPPAADAAWTNYNIGDDAFNVQKGRAWFMATLPALKSEKGKIVHFASIDETATVYLNGVKIGGHNGWNQSFDLPLDANWKTDGPNQLVVLIGNEDNTGGIDKPVTVLAQSDSAPATAWKMRGGPSPQPSAQAWKPLLGTAKVEGPQWYHTTFTAPAASSTLPIWRFKTKGLSRGSVWLNGHNLGRYPEKVPVDGMYMPENWINAGANTLEIFDEEGNSPAAVSVETETAASRDLLTVTSR